MNLAQTPSQTVGPFFHYGLVFGGENILATEKARGTGIVITGRVLDGDRAAVPDALLELWHADAAGIYPHPGDSRHAEADPNFRGFGRSDTTHAGQRFRFETVKPGRVLGPDGTRQAPHACLRIFARGLLTHLTTRLYFADETEANAGDAVLAGIDPTRRGTVLAMPKAGTAEPRVYELDLVLQGEGETVFFTP
jgi:protocatechuate 3,4-dioxygenase, alpha subunit